MASPKPPKIHKSGSSASTPNAKIKSGSSATSTPNASASTPNAKIKSHSSATSTPNSSASTPNAKIETASSAASTPKVFASTPNAKIKTASSAASTPIGNATTKSRPSSKSPQVDEESPFTKFANNLTPLKPVKPYHVAQGVYIDVSCPGPVFTSPDKANISLNRKLQYLESLVDEIENPGYQPPLSEGYITEIQKDIYANTENRSPTPSTPSVGVYLADPGEIDQATFAEIQSSSLSDYFTESKEFLLNLPGDDKANQEEPLPLSEESNYKVHQEIRPAAHVEEIQGEIKSDVYGGASQEHTNSAEHVSDKQYCHDSLPQYVGNDQDQQHHSDCAPQKMPNPLQDVENCNEIVSTTSQVNEENIITSQDGSEVIKIV